MCLQAELLGSLHLNRGFLMYYDFFGFRDFSLMLKVRCGSCGRLVTVNMKDVYCPICRKKLHK